MMRPMTPCEVAVRLAAERGGRLYPSKAELRERMAVRRAIIERQRDLAIERLEAAFDDLGAELPRRESAFKPVRVGFHVGQKGMKATREEV